MPFYKGHKINKGRKHTAEAVANMRAAKMGDKNPMYNGGNAISDCQKCSKDFEHYKSKARKYCSKRCSDYKGDDATYLGKHLRVYRAWGKAHTCEACGRTEGQVDWANISRTYQEARSDWVMLCRSCHVKYDRYKYTLEELGYVRV